MRLIIAEKTAVAEAIAATIPGETIKKSGYLQKGNDIITWASGHLLQLKEPEDYDPKYGKWQLEDLPIFFLDWGLKPISQRNISTSHLSQLDIIGRLLQQADSVIHAGDPDDEGQLLIDEILRWFHYRGPIYRMNTNDTTSSALYSAIQNLTDNKDKESFGWAAHARRVADAIVGYNCSRYFTIKNPKTLLTVGRVQTATLGLVVLRDQEINAHKKRPYYSIFANIKVADKTIKAAYQPPKTGETQTDEKIFTKEDAQRVISMISSQTSLSVTISHKEFFENPPLPFNLTELQLYCNKKFSYDPSRVLSITQTLRDKYKAITYNRSDCQYLSETQFSNRFDTMAQVTNNISFNPKGMDMTIHGRCFDDQKLTAHTAIIPQNTPVDITSMTEEEKTVYLAICKFFMTQFFPPAKKGQTSLYAPLPDGGHLVATATVILERGYRYLFRDHPDEQSSKNSESALPKIPPSFYFGSVDDVMYEIRETSPPPFYTKASLLKDMTQVAKYVKDPVIRDLLIEKDKGKKGENGAIGTVATRSQIIDTLFTRGYLLSNGNTLTATPLGRELYRILPDQLKKPDMTAYWWQMQQGIQNGTLHWTAMINSVLNAVQEILQTEYPHVDFSLIPNDLRRNKTSAIGVCPRCGGNIREAKTKFFCTNYSSGCKFVIWKRSKLPMLSRTIFTEADAKKFLAGDPVRKRNLVAANTGNLFSGSLTMIDDPSNSHGPKFVLVPHRKKGRGELH